MADGWLYVRTARDRGVADGGVRLEWRYLKQSGLGLPPLRIARGRGKCPVPFNTAPI
jgi:hypothetical protein